MKFYDYSLYNELLTTKLFENDYVVMDHLNGFDCDLNNDILHAMNRQLNPNKTVFVSYIPSRELIEKYPNITLRYSAMQYQNLFKRFNRAPCVTTDKSFSNFICSFNGSMHTSRILLTSILHKSGYFAQGYCSKNISYTEDMLDGVISEYTGDTERFYRKFFVVPDSNFYETLYSIGKYDLDSRVLHNINVQELASSINSSFVHVVSETMSTSYYPFVTEKFLNSVIHKGLFVSYAQPEWHQHLDKYFGFKRYDKVFDYSFDYIANPVVRLVEMMTMLSKFSVLSKFDWHDLYLIEKDTLDYNYEHFVSEDYLNNLTLYF